MGSCMMIAVAREPQLEEDAKAWCTAHGLDSAVREELLIRALEQRAAAVEISEDLIGFGDSNTITDEHGVEIYEDDPGWEQALNRAIRGALVRGVRTIMENVHEVTSLRMADGFWLATGGPSWGDLPTDAYESMNLVDAYEITGAPVAVAEIAAAAASTAAAAASTAATTASTAATTASTAATTGDSAAN